MLSFVEGLEEEDQLRALAHQPNDSFDLRDYDILVDMDSVWYVASSQINCVVRCADLEKLTQWRTIADVYEENDFDYWNARFDYKEVYEHNYIYPSYNGEYVSFVDDVNLSIVVLKKSNESILD